MDNISALRRCLHVGSPIRMVFYTAQGAVAIKASISSKEPLAVYITDAGAKMVAAGNRTLLVVFDRNQYYKAEAAVMGINEVDGHWVFDLSDEMWEEVDRRRYARQDIKLPVNLRAIQETEDGSKIHHFVGTTEDISVGGAWVQLDHPIEAGSLVEFETTLPGEEQIRLLGIVAHGSGKKQGFGIEFLDYVGGARYTLSTYLSQLAA